MDVARRDRLYGPASADVAALAAALRAQNLSVEAIPGDDDALRITGTASAIAASFGTALHSFRKDGVISVAPVSTPVFKGEHADMIAGITGLGSTRMAPYFKRPLGAARSVSPGTIANPDALFTNSCFRKDKTLSYSRFSLGGVTTGTYTGPEYVANGAVQGSKLCGYTPAQIAGHYHLNAAYAKGLTGKGQTIVLVEAYGSPSIFADANVFAAKFGLPALTAQNLAIVQPDGTSATNPYKTDWPVETSLDVEWAHAIAPDAKIVIVEAPSDDSTELAYALHYAIKNQLGTIISNSYGYDEYASGTVVAQAFNTIARQAAAQGIAVNVSAGDSGDIGLGTPFGAASIPADSPYATAIGGTSLNVPSDNGPVDSVWGTTVTFLASIEGVSNPPGIEGFQSGTGGGESNIFAMPKWQQQAALPGAGRQLPDISAVADPQTGGIVALPNTDGTASVLTVIGGTSLASPVFSGIWALAQQQAGSTLGQAAPIIAALHGKGLVDIVPVVASNDTLSAVVTHAGTTTTYDPATLLGLNTTQPTGFVGTSTIQTLSSAYDLSFGADSSLMAAPGWDTATGWGEPDGLAFIKAVAKAGH